MASHSDKDFTFISVTVGRPDMVFLLAEPDNRAILGVGFTWGKGKVIGQSNFTFAPLRVDSVPGKERTAIGVEGDWLLSRGGSVTTGVIDSGPNAERQFHLPMDDSYIAPS